MIGKPLETILVLTILMLAGCMQQPKEQFGYFGGPDNPRAHAYFEENLENYWTHVYAMDFDWDPEGHNLSLKFRVSPTQLEPGYLRILAVDLDLINYRGDDFYDRVGGILSINFEEPYVDRDKHWDLRFERMEVREFNATIGLKPNITFDGLISNVQLAYMRDSDLHDQKIRIKNQCWRMIEDDFMIDTGLFPGYVSGSSLPLKSPCDPDGTYYPSYSKYKWNTVQIRTQNLPPPEDEAFWSNYCAHCYAADSGGLDVLPSTIAGKCFASEGMLRYDYGSACIEPSD